MSASPTLKALRADTVARLVAADIVPAEAALPSRTAPLRGDHPVVLCVFTPADRAEGRGKHLPTFNETLKLVVEAHRYDVADTDLDEALDDLAEAIKEALLCDTEWVSQFEAVSSVNVLKDLDEKSDRIRGTAQVVFELAGSVTYAPAAQAAAVPFQTAQFDTDIAPADGEVDSAVTTAIPEA